MYSDDEEDGAPTGKARNLALAGVTLAGIIAVIGVPLLLEGHERTAIEAEAAQRADFEAEQAEAAAEAAEQQVVTELRAASEDRLGEVLNACRASVLEKAGQGDNPFRPFLIDEYSADIHQAAAYANGGIVRSIDERVADGLRARSDGSQTPDLLLNTRFTVGWLGDAIGAGRMRTLSYSCDLGPGLAIAGVRQH